MAKKMYKLSNSDKTTFYTPDEVKAIPAPASTRPEEREFVVDSGASVHMTSKKKELISEETDTVKGSRTPLRYWLPGEKCTPTRRHKCSFTIKIYSWLCTYSRKRQQSYRLEDSAKTTDTPFEWVSGQRPRLTKDGKSIICKTDNFVPLVVPGLSANSGSVSSSTSPSQDSWRREVEIAAGNSMRPASSSSSGSVLERSDEEASGIWCDPPKTQNKNKKEGWQEKFGRPFWQIFLSGWRSSKEILWTQNCLHPHAVLRNQV